MTPAAANRIPTKAVIAFTHFHSARSIKSINRMPSANSVSRMMGSAQQIVRAGKEL